MVFFPCLKAKPSECPDFIWVRREVSKKRVPRQGVPHAEQVRNQTAGSQTELEESGGTAATPFQKRRKRGKHSRKNKRRVLNSCSRKKTPRSFVAIFFFLQPSCHSLVFNTSWPFSRLLTARLEPRLRVLFQRFSLVDLFCVFDCLHCFVYLVVSNRWCCCHCFR